MVLLLLKQWMNQQPWKIESFTNFLHHHILRHPLTDVWQTFPLSAFAKVNGIICIQFANLQNCCNFSLQASKSNKYYLMV